eukprot:7321880-Alexandrium_andersonii.AAC.1
MADYEAAADSRAGPAPPDFHHPYPPDGRAAEWKLEGDFWHRITKAIPAGSVAAAEKRAEW